MALTQRSFLISAKTSAICKKKNLQTGLNWQQWCVSTLCLLPKLNVRTAVCSPKVNPGKCSREHSQHSQTHSFIPDSTHLTSPSMLHPPLGCFYPTGVAFSPLHSQWPDPAVAAAPDQAKEKAWSCQGLTLTLTAHDGLSCLKALPPTGRPTLCTQVPPVLQAVFHSHTNKTSGLELLLNSDNWII